MKINIPNTVPSKPLPQASSSDDNNAPWEHEDVYKRQNITIGGWLWILLSKIWITIID